MFFFLMFFFTRDWLINCLSSWLICSILVARLSKLLLTQKPKKAILECRCVEMIFLLDIDSVGFFVRFSVHVDMIFLYLYNINVMWLSYMNSHIVDLLNPYRLKLNTAQTKLWFSIGFVHEWGDQSWVYTWYYILIYCLYISHFHSDKNDLKTHSGWWIPPALY